MSQTKPYVCGCENCQSADGSREKELHRRINLFLSQLDNRQRRLFVGLESYRMGRCSDTTVAKITGLGLNTISTGRRQLASLSFESLNVSAKKRRTGRPLTEVKQPNLEVEIEKLIEDEAAGDPMTEQKWIRISLRQLSKKLREKDLSASHCTVRRILKKMGFSLRANFKKKNGVRANRPERDEQFKYIASQREEFSRLGLPVISVDTKKRELIGDFHKKGKTWRKRAEEVNEHDFRSLAICKAVPYGIYDLNKKLGYVYVGTSNATPRFAIEAIARWWKNEDCLLYPGAKGVLILADGGGCNGCHSRAWKYQLQKELSNKFDLVVTVCHYPTGCSKWNPIERRLFSYISINWSGKPLRTLEVMLGYIRGTTTTTGLVVKAFLLDGFYEKGQRVSAKEISQLSIYSHETCPDWNYTIYPN